MVEGMERSSEIVYEFLRPWHGLDSFINFASSALSNLSVKDYHDSTRDRVYAAITEYLLAERGDALKDYWARIEVTPGQVEVDKVNPDQPTMMRLNGICGFYGAPRVIIHLYLHMYLLCAIGVEYDAFLDDMNATIEKYYRA